jgi:hypothetical protein
MKTWIAAIAAVVVQPLVFAARMTPDLIGSSQSLYGLGFFFVAVLSVAAGATLLFGVPAFFVLRKYGHDGWLSLGLTGFLIGAIPLSFSWPAQSAGYSAGGNWHGKYVELYINGVPTEYAWLTYAENIALFGLHGLIGALVFYGVWRRLSRSNHSLHPTPSAPAELKR